MTWRKKQTVREKIISFNNDDSLPKMSIYSTLSKKPADLKTTDVDMSAIRVFLSDGSHRTMSSGPTTTCGDILDSLLTKLGLFSLRELYGLQIKYTFSDARIADDDEKVSELNRHVWDSIDRIFLYKKTGFQLKRKRVASFNHVQFDHVQCEDQCNIYENAAITCKVTDTDESGEVNAQPSLLNEVLAGGFAKAWSVGSELHEAGQSGGQKPLELCCELEPTYGNVGSTIERSSGFYTLDRKSRVRKSPRESPSMPRKMHLNSKPREAVDTTPKEDCDHFTVQTASNSKSPINVKHAAKISPDDSPTHEHHDISHSSWFLSPLAKRRNVPIKADGNLSNALISQRSRSVDSLAKVLEQEHGRDSGFSEVGSQMSLNDFRLGKKFHHKHPHTTPKLGKSSHSVDCIPTIFSSAPQHLWNPPISSKSFAASSSSLATCAYKASSSQQQNKSDQKLQTAQSIERLALGEVKHAHRKKSRHSQNQLSGLGSKQSQIPPPVPKRSSSSLQNCTISDDYLISQGKRMSQLLQFTPRKEKSALKSLQAAFSKFGTLMRRSRTSSIDTSDGASTAHTRRTLGFPSALISYKQTSCAAPDEKLEDYNYIPISSVSSIPKPKPKTPAELGDTSTPNYLALIGGGVLASPVMPSNVGQLQQHTPRNTASSADQSTSAHALAKKEQQIDNDQQYMNTHIQTGPNHTITLDGSTLHDYIVPSNIPVTHETLPEMHEALYGNSEIHVGKNGGIGIGGDDLHVYHVPSLQGRPPTPPPPPLPPKPFDTDATQTRALNTASVSAVGDPSMSQSAQVPATQGYSKLVTNKMAPPTFFVKPPPPPGPPPPDIPPLTRPKPKMSKSKSINSSLTSIKFQPLPEPPLETYRDSGGYDKILSPPPHFGGLSDDEYMDMSSEGVPQDMNTNATQPSMKAFTFHTTAVAPPPPPLPPLSNARITLSDPVIAPSGDIHRSWTAPLEDPSQQLNTKLRMQLEILQKKASQGTTSNMTSTSHKIPPSPPEKPKKVPLLPPNTNEKPPPSKSSSESEHAIARAIKKPVPPPPPPPPPPPSHPTTSQVSNNQEPPQSKGKQAKPKGGGPPPPPPPPPPPHFAPKPLPANRPTKPTGPPAKSSSQSSLGCSTGELFALELSQRLSSLSQRNTS